MSGIPYVLLDDPRYGELVQVSPLVQRVIARNPGKFTAWGTGTYIVGGDDCAVIDPGPVSPSHREALVRALDGRTVRYVVVTHCHSDHSPLAPWLAAETGALTVGSGPHLAAGPEWERSEWPEFPLPPEVLEELRAEAAQSDVAMEEGIDTDFRPDMRTTDGHVAARGHGWTLRAMHTPGHAPNHLCVALEEERALFTGDHVMGWSTTVVSPPDGDMVAYLTSLRRCIDRADDILYPTHGAPITDPGPFLHAYLQHRLDRESQILAEVRAGRGTIAEIVPALYAQVHVALWAAAARSVMAHLLKLVDDGAIRAEGGTTHPSARFTVA